MRIGTNLVCPPLVAAPMAGISDLANRRIAREFGAAWVVSEMISAKGVIYDQAKTWELLACDDDEPLAVQLFGSVPEEVAEAAAAVVARIRPLAIDINMGCPTPKIVRSGDGSALLKDPKLAGEIVRQTVRAVSIPVTVKTRKAWDANSPDCLELVREVEYAGAAAVTIHGRTREQFYSGRADWGIIQAVKRAVSIPVIGNGDVVSAASALAMREQTGCDGVMVGRAAIGNPWVYRDIVRAFRGLAVASAPSVGERVAMAERHLALAVSLKGEYRGIREMRLQLAWYLRGLPGAAKLRDRINKADTLPEINELLSGLK